MKSLCALVFIAALPALADRVYVTNERAGTLSVIDSATDAIVATKTTPTAISFAFRCRKVGRGS